MEDLIIISNLNDFIFCPASIYFHKLYGNEEKLMFQTERQLNGTKAHEAIDSNKYSTSKNIITSLEVYSEQYGLVGKIDVYDKSKNMLVERKKHVKVVYDGYIFQLYGQYYAMTEMEYKVDKMRIHSVDDNKNYEIPLPENNILMKRRFEQLISEIRIFDLQEFQQTCAEKCRNCIYEDACDRTLNIGD